MGLLWRFMGLSYTYNFFGGVCEIFSGVLLFFKRTTLLGVLIVVAIMTNVVLLNFSYDVPVKLFSMHLLALSLFLIGPDLSRLFRFLVLNKAVSAKIENQFYIKPGKKYLYVFTKVIVIAILVGLPLRTMMRIKREMQNYESGTDLSKPVFGGYDVKKFIVDGNLIAPEEFPTWQWKELKLESTQAYVKFMDESSMRWALVNNEGTGRIIFISEYASISGKFDYKADGDMLKLTGMFNDKSTQIELIKKSSFPLVERGFHWINEFPFQ